MASYASVDIPIAIRNQMGGLLEKFELWVADKVVKKKTKVKSPGNHLTAWWLHVWLGDTKKTRLIFGETDYEAVNPIPHLWVEGTPALLPKGLLRKFLRNERIEFVSEKTACTRAVGRTSKKR